MRTSLGKAIKEVLREIIAFDFFGYITLNVESVFSSPFVFTSKVGTWKIISSKGKLQWYDVF